MTFRLVKLGLNEAHFDGLTFRRSVDRLQIFSRLERRKEKCEKRSSRWKE